MKIYPKINTIWKRDKDGKIIEGELSDPEVACIKEWRASEKIDGTNVRVQFKKFSGASSFVAFGGRTENASLPQFLKNVLATTFTMELMEKTFDYLKPGESVVLFGEGYGPKIQNGGNYSDEVGFVLFDVWFDTDRERYPAGLWANREAVERIAESLKIEVVREYDATTISEIINLVKSDKLTVSSALALDHGKVSDIEGFVVRPTRVLLRQNGDPIMWKIKRRDFKTAQTLNIKTDIQ